MYALVGTIKTPLRKEILHIPIAQSEPGVAACRMMSGGRRWRLKEMVSIPKGYTGIQIEIRALNVT